MGREQGADRMPDPTFGEVALYRRGTPSQKGRRRIYFTYFRRGKGQKRSEGLGARKTVPSGEEPKRLLDSRDSHRTTSLSYRREKGRGIRFEALLTKERESPASLQREKLQRGRGGRSISKNGVKIERSRSPLNRENGKIAEAQAAILLLQEAGRDTKWKKRDNTTRIRILGKKRGTNGGRRPL